MRRLPLDASAWRRISPYLDRALELEPPERDGWLTGLTTTDPQIAHDVRAFLAEIAALDARGFLSPSQLRVPRDVAWTGTRIGAYTIEERIGRGGMGEVWLACRSDGVSRAARRSSCSTRRCSAVPPSSGLCAKVRCSRSSGIRTSHS